MKTLFLYLKEMQSMGLISSYALGGATALVYYFEPVQTQDIDLFIVLTDKKDSLVNLSPIYSYLAERNVELKNEYVIVEGVPVQFLVPYNALVEEAISKAVEVDFNGASIPVPPIEYLMAIMLQTWRMKDRSRLEELIKNQDLFDSKKVLEIAARYSLEKRWGEFQI